MKMTGVLFGGVLSLSFTSGDLTHIQAAGHVYARPGYAQLDVSRANVVVPEPSRLYAEAEGSS
jgi:hypothetical protein